MQDENLVVKRLEHLEKLVESTESNLDKIKAMVDLLKKDLSKDKYREMEGVEGIYDGEFLVTKDGKKLDVPANYAAKSRLVCGDKLKVINDEGKSIFKQIDKVTRRKIEGILSKKEGKWFILSDTGSYRVSNNAIEFNNVVLGDEAVAFIPEANLNVTYAALDKVLKKKLPQSQESVPQVQSGASVKTPSKEKEVAATPVKSTQAIEKKPLAENKPAQRPAAKPPVKTPNKSAKSPVNTPRKSTSNVVKPLVAVAPKSNIVQKTSEMPPVKEEISAITSAPVVDDSALDDDDLR